MFLESTHKPYDISSAWKYFITSINKLSRKIRVFLEIPKHFGNFKLYWRLQR